jgi:hypothetical protein
LQRRPAQGKHQAVNERGRSETFAFLPDDLGHFMMASKPFMAFAFDFVIRLVLLSRKSLPLLR